MTDDFYKLAAQANRRLAAERARNARQKNKPAVSPEDIAKFKRLIQSGLSINQACTSLNISHNRASKILAKAATEAATELRLELFESLREHIKSNAPAAVFAAKAKLGWQDVQKIEQTQTVEYIDLPDRETREQWQRRQELRLVKAANSKE